MTNNFTHKTVAWDDIALNDLAQTLKVVIVADDQSTADSRTGLFVSLNDVDMDVVILPELPGQRDAFLTSS